MNDKRETINEEREFGLIGHPLTHSFSKQYFDNKFKEEGLMDVVFNEYDIESIDELQTIISNKNIKGLAVTIPYKQAVVRILDGCDNIVKEIDACNCIKIFNSKLIGFNTDVIGFEKSFTQNLKPYHTKALVLGNGGAAQAIKYVLQKLSIDFTIVTRNKTEESISYEDVDEAIIQSHLIIINTTPLGTFPKVDECPNIPYQHITPQHYLFDLVYNPPVTTFMNKGLQRNAFAKNGYEMLCIQAEENWRIWNEFSQG